MEATWDPVLSVGQQSIFKPREAAYLSHHAIVGIVIIGILVIVGIDTI